MCLSYSLFFAAKRSSLIKHTKLAAVAFLNELPMTKHDLQSFALDVSMATVRLH